MKILILSRSIPFWRHDPRAQRQAAIMAALSRLGEVHLLPLYHSRFHKKDKSLLLPSRDTWFRTKNSENLETTYSRNLRRLGVTLLPPIEPDFFMARPTHDLRLQKYLASRTYDVIVIEQFYFLDRHIREVRKYQPQATLILDAVELHFLKLEEQAQYLSEKIPFLTDSRHRRRSLDASHAQKIEEAKRQSLHVKEYELQACRKVDLVLVSSSSELRALQREQPRSNVFVFPHAVDAEVIGKTVRQRGAPKRSGLGVVGNFREESDFATVFQLKHVLMPDLDFQGELVSMGGVNPSPEVRSMKEFGIGAHRFRSNFHPLNRFGLFERVRAVFSPVFFGSGTASNLAEAAYFGAPILTNAQGASLAGLEKDRSCLIAESAADLAQAWKSLQSDGALSQRLRMAAFDDQAKRVAVLKEKLGQCVQELVAKKRLEEKSLFPGRATGEVFLDAYREKLPRVSKPEEMSGKPGLSHRAALSVFRKAIGKESPVCSIIIPCHNQWAFTRLCLDQIFLGEKLPQEIILIDNGSSDETRKESRRISGRHGQFFLRVIRNSTNIGFVKAANQGMEAAQGENLLIAHNDTLLPSFWLSSFLEKKARIPGLAAVGPAINTETGQEIQRIEYGGLESYRSVAQVWFQKNRGSWDTVRRLSGVCLFLPRETYSAVGGFDEKYGMGFFEDDDLSLRIRKTGGKLVWDRSVFVHHFGGVTLESGLFDRDTLFERSMAQFVHRWGSRGIEHTKEHFRKDLTRIRFNPTV